LKESFEAIWWEAMYENMGNHLLVGRVGEAREIARAYLFLRQERYSTGSTVGVDGGALLT
jgi:NAD(P)-dependent dehydrogenase (short-subunit alcohol dehydrogenase family)